MSKTDLLDLIKWPCISEAAIDRCVEYLREGKISIQEGDVLEEFESEFAHYNDIRYCLSFNNGTSALFSAYYALGLEKDDEVLVPVNTWTATVTPLVALNLKPVFCDVDPMTLNINLADAERKVTARTKAICIVHMWGNPCNMDKVIEFKDRFGLKLIEDCSHAHGALFRNRKVGTFGDIGCFSMQATKVLPAGEMGAAITDNELYYNRMVSLGQQGRIDKLATSPEYAKFTGGLGYKFRPFPLALIIAIDQLRVLDDTNCKRNSMVDIFNAILSKCSNVQIFLSEELAYRTCYSYIFAYRGNVDLLVEQINKTGLKCTKMRYKMLTDIAPFCECNHDETVAGKLMPFLVMLDPINTEEKHILEYYAKTVADIINNMEEGGNAFHMHSENSRTTK